MKATERQALWAVLTFFLGLAGTAFIIATLLYTRTATKAAQKSADAAAAQIGLARLEFGATHRPRFVIREVHKAVAEGNSRIIFSIVNIGDASGTLIEEGLDLVIVPHGKFALTPTPVAKHEMDQTKLDPGGRIDVQMAIGLAERMIMLPETESLRVTGSVHLAVVLVYTDASKNKRRTVAQRKFIREDGTFLDLGNPNYEYSD